jgi:hypothetical protein
MALLQDGKGILFSKSNQRRLTERFINKLPLSSFPDFLRVYRISILFLIEYADYRNYTIRRPG